MAEVRVSEAWARKHGVQPAKAKRAKGEVAVPDLPEDSGLWGRCKQCGELVYGGISGDPDARHVRAFHKDRGGCVIEYKVADDGSFAG